LSASCTKKDNSLSGGWHPDAEAKSRPRAPTTTKTETMAKTLKEETNDLSGTTQRRGISAAPELLRAKNGATKERPV